MWKQKAGGVSQALNESIDQFDTKTEEVPIQLLRDTSNAYLLASGFTDEEARLTTDNLVEAELAGKSSHGVIRLNDLRALQASGDIVTGTTGLESEICRDDVLFYDAAYMSGSVALYRSLDQAFVHMEQRPQQSLLAVGIRNMSYASGYIGDYARLAAERGFAFLSFFNSPPILIPHGSRDPQWGTDPVTFSFPRGDGGHPVIHDSASSVITWGEMMNAKRQGRSIPEDCALDEAGEPTVDPQEGMKGGLLTAGGHKSSGLALMVELLAGALTGSRVGSAVAGGWGGMYLLMRTGMFRGDESPARQDADLLLNVLTSSSPREGFDRVRYPGQQSAELRRQALERGSIALPKLLWQQICQAREP